MWLKFFSEGLRKIPALFRLEGLDLSASRQNIEDEGVSGKILRGKELESLAERRMISAGRQPDLYSEAFARMR
jgi:hypothetical protein